MNQSDNSDNENDKEEEEEEEKSPDKKELLTNIVNDLLNKKELEQNDEEHQEDTSYNEKPNPDGYESPDENKIAEECENIEIATIKDITEEPIEGTGKVEELNYDNVDIIDAEKQNEDLMETFKNNLLTLEDQNVDQEVTGNNKEIIDVKSDLSSPRVINIEDNLDPQLILFNMILKKMLKK